MRALLVSLLLFAPASASAQNPVERVLQLLADLATKVTKEGEASKKLHEEFFDYCGDQEQKLGFRVKDHTADVARLEAKIAQSSASLEEAKETVQTCSAKMAKHESDMGNAQRLRNGEIETHRTEEAQMADIVSALSRAIPLMQKKASDGTAMVQVKQASCVTEALRALVQASGVHADDAATITALIQTSDSEHDEETGAPVASEYERSGGSIIKVMQNLLAQAQEQLAAVRKKEVVAGHDHTMLKQSVDSSLSNLNQELLGAKDASATHEGALAASQGDLAEAQTSLKAVNEEIRQLKLECQQKASDYEAEQKSRAEELNAIAEAKRVIEESIKPAEALTYATSTASFLQERTKRASTKVGISVLQFVRKLAERQESAALSQLERRLSLTVRAATTQGADPFSKVRSLIETLLEKLIAEANQEATEKKWCDDEKRDTTAKKVLSQEAVAKHTAHLDEETATLNKLSHDLSGLHTALKDLAEANKKQDALRAQEKELYAKSSAEMKQGIDGVQTALRILRNYYNSDDHAHQTSTASNSGIVSMLEVVESDLSKALSELDANEQESELTYTKFKQESDISRAVQEQDVKYKTKKRTSHEKTKAEVSSDLRDSQEEFDANVEYLRQLAKQCTMHKETYAERKERREREINGLKEALQMLDDGGSSASGVW